MKYKLTLLKDLPRYPAGTVFSYEEGYYRGCGGSGLVYNRFCCVYGGTPQYPLCIPEEIINNPEWIKKEIDFTGCIDIKCPVCGETRGNIEINAWRSGDKYDGYSSRACVYIEYACGHDRRCIGSI